MSFRSFFKGDTFLLLKKKTFLGHIFDKFCLKIKTVYTRYPEARENNAALQTMQDEEEPTILQKIVC